MGIHERIEVTGVFPAIVPAEIVKDPLSITTNLTGWKNYASAEEQMDIVQNLFGLENKCYIIP